MDSKSNLPKNTYKLIILPHATTVLAASGRQNRISVRRRNLANTVFPVLRGPFITVQTTYGNFGYLFFLEILELGHVLLNVVDSAFETSALFAT